MSPASPHRLRREVRRAAALAARLALAFALLAGGLKLVDLAVGATLPATGFLDAESDRPTIRLLDPYPYDGMHMQANFRHRGPMLWDENHPDADYDVRSGDKGFFVDFRLEDPPPKGPDELRVILVGGSGAQGWGGTRNETMFYSVLERRLNERLAPRGLRVRVINLAMGTASVYQNFIALNLWGHALEPDLILAYVGRNEFYVPLAHEQGTDYYTFFGDLAGFSAAARGSEFPPRLRWLAGLMPNTMRRTGVGLGLKIAADWPWFKQRGRELYARSGGPWVQDPRRVIEELAVPRMIHSLKSIKRDFEGVPMIVARQAIRREFELLRDYVAPDFYDRMWERTRRELGGYLNDDWHFVDVHAIGSRIAPASFQTHLDDTAHAITGLLLADEIERDLPDILARRKKRKGAPSPGRRG